MSISYEKGEELIKRAPPKLSEYQGIRFFVQHKGIKIKDSSSLGMVYVVKKYGNDAYAEKCSQTVSKYKT